MWFGTARGLLRYDGVANRRYRHDPDNPQSITAGLVRVLLEDDSGRFWVGTTGGLNLLNRRTGTFTRYRHNPDDVNSISSNNIWSLLDDDQGGLWIGTDQGLDYLRDGRIARFGKSLPAREEGVSGLAEADRTLWAATSNGLHYYEQEKKRFKTLTMPKPLRILVLASDPQGRLWLGTLENGLVRVENQVFHYFSDVPEHRELLGSGRIASLAFDQRNQLLVGGDQGLFQYHLETGEVRRHTHDPANPESLRHPRIDALFSSKDHLVWAATASNGVDILDPNTEKFHALDLKNQEAWSIFKDSADTLWVGVFDGLARISPTGETRWSFDGSRVYFVAEHGDALYCGTTDAFYRVNPATGEAMGPPLLKDLLFRRFLATGEDNLWLGTQKGLYRYHPDSGETHVISAEQGSSKHLSNPLITSMVEDGDGSLWIGTFGGGLNRLDPKTLRVQHFLPSPQGLSAGDVIDLAVDFNGHLWIATLSGGLNLYNPKTRSFQRFTVKEGFPDNAVAYIILDGQGHLWAKTGNGVVRLKLEDHSQTVYQEDDGFLESSGIPGARFKDPKDGSLYFGGIDGVTHFHPNDVYEPVEPQLLFTGFKRDNREVAHLIPPGEIEEVQPQDKTFSLEFAVLDYRTPNGNRFAYLREDLDKDWVGSQGKGLVDYTRYLTYGGMGALKIRGTNGYGVSNEATLLLKAPAPLWVSTLPISVPLTVSFLIWLIWLAITRREKHKRARLEEQARMAEERAKLAENRQKVERRGRRLQEEYNRAIQEHLEQVSTEIANELHDGPLSELTGVTYTLDTIAHDMSAQPQQPRIQELTQQALPNIAASLRDLCGDLLAPDFEAGLDVEMDAYADVVEKRCPGMRIERNLEETENLAAEQMACLFRIYRTLLKNVEKHAGADEVVLTLKVNQEYVFMEIKDNGCGFHAPSNWESFKKEKHYGMYMASYFADSLGGSLQVDSAPGAGTTARVTAPIKIETRSL